MLKKLFSMDPFKGYKLRLAGVDSPTGNMCKRK